MPQSMPDAVTLLKAAINYFESELLPTLGGYHRFKTRVAVNVLNTLRRELEMSEAQRKDECQRLIEILGHSGEVEGLSAELCERIRSGAIALDDAVLRAHIRQSLAEALSINNPKWMER